MYENELYHYGVKGMKWGVRRYVKKDGTLTRKGKRNRENALKGLDEGLKGHNTAKNLSREMLESSETYNKARRKYSNEKEAQKYGYNAKPYTKEELTSIATGYLNNYMNHKKYELLKSAYETDRIRVGEDYISDKYGRVTLSESGRAKESIITDEARRKTIEDNRDIIKRYDIK